MQARTGGSGRRTPPRGRAARNPRAVRLAALLAVAATGALVTGIVVGAGHTSGEQRVAERYAAAWTRGDFAAMYAQLDDASRERIDRRSFLAAHERALATATARRMRAGKPERDGGNRWRIPVRLRTRSFGSLREVAVLQIGADGVAWSPEMAFPGLRRGEKLQRLTEMPPRAALLARDKTVLAQGPARTGDTLLASSIVGLLGQAPPERRARLRELGVPDWTPVGLGGLERVFDERLLGTPGGELLAGRRVLARSVPRAAEPVRTTISLRVQKAAVAALGPRLGGVVVLDPRSGAVLAAAGIGFSVLQPPGSTFKIVTVTGALEAGVTGLGESYPVQTEAVLEGVALANANGESCGGSLTASFAHSCNSVFAPMGAALGAERLVATAERFGFNAPTGLPGAATSTIPPANEIGDDLAVGSSAIGQGRVQATALQMAIVAAAIGNRGRRAAPVLDLAASRDDVRTRRATDPATARTVEKLMLAVVREGTGTRAAIPGVKVAGKTGTAELETTQPTCVPDPADPDACPPPEPDDPTDTDAWFAAYAPAGDGRPRAAVGVLLVGSGAGGDTAAPVARQVLSAALKATA